MNPFTTALDALKGAPLFETPTAIIVCYGVAHKLRIMPDRTVTLTTRSVSDVWHGSIHKLRRVLNANDGSELRVKVNKAYKALVV